MCIVRKEREEARRFGTEGASPMFFCFFFVRRFIKTSTAIVSEASLKKVELTSHDRGWVYHRVGTFDAGEHEIDAHRAPYVEYG